MRGEGRSLYLYALTAMVAAVFAAGRASASDIAPDSPAEAGEPKQGARMTFVSETHDFGDISRRGGDAEWRFEFVNDGDEPLIITQVKTTCTCLRYKYPRRPVAAGQSGHIDISFEPHKTEAGVFHRVVMVYSNSADGVRRLIVQGNSIDNKRKQ